MTKASIAAGIVILLIASSCTMAWHAALPPIQPPATFPPQQIARGAELVAIGDCAVCHTARNGAAFAGGRPIATPFGTIYATNITPDPQTGIGQWSLRAFRRAMRDGIDRAGHHLYPVLPYPHFTRATDSDIAAMYAFLMTRTPVSQETPANTLPFPIDQRPIMAAWNLLYLRRGPWQPDPAHDETWNRGNYLVTAIGHCGACHTPHNLLGAEETADRLAGGTAEDWYAPPLQAASPAPTPWTRQSLETYLRSGFEAQHGAAAGPMTAVTRELARVPADDIRAIATYIAAQMHQTPTQTTPTQTTPPATTAATTTATTPTATTTTATTPPQASALFAGACGGCHAADAPMTRHGAPSLARSTVVQASTPQGVIQIILKGIPWHDGQAQPYMPAFAAALTDTQVAAIAAYVRHTYSDQPPWTDLPASVAKLRGAS